MVTTPDECNHYGCTRLRASRQGYAQHKVIDSDCTLLLSSGRSGGRRKTEHIAQRLGKPCRLVSLDSTVRNEDVVRRMAVHGIVALNMAGPRESERPVIDGLTLAFLDAVQSLGA